MKRVDWTDHQFARWLRSQNAERNYIHSDNTAEYRNSDGQLIARVVFDIGACTRAICISGNAS